MSPNLHALLIGIDAYQGEVSSLNGCVNDIDAIQRILIDRLKTGPERITRLASPRYGTRHETDVPTDKPTRANILKAFEKLGGSGVGAGDRVFIYYSGHGTQVPVQVGSDTFVREALLPSDHDSVEWRFVFDWELSTLLTRIVARTSSVTFVIDACCSAGATRGDLDPPGSRVRFFPVSIDRYALRGRRMLDAGDSGLASGLLRSVQDCQVVTACLADERAHESGSEHGPLPPHGDLTRALIERLTAGGITAEELPDLRWARIWRPMVADVTRSSPAQHPWISGDLIRPVFGGPPERGDAGIGVTREGDAYRLDAGTLADVTEAAKIAIYGMSPPVFPAIASAADEAARIGVLVVTSADRMSAKAVAEKASFDLPPGARGRLVEPGHGAKLLVALDPPDPRLAAEIATSNRLEVAGAGVRGDVTLVRRADGGRVVTDEVFGTGAAADDPVLCVIPPARRDRTVPVLEHYQDYARPLRMAKNCVDLPGRLVLRVLDCNGREPTAEEAASAQLAECPAGRRANYELKVDDRVCFRVDNTSAEPLLVTLIDCQPDGTVIRLGEATLAAKASQLFWYDEMPGRPFAVSLPDGRKVGVDRLVAIGTTDRDKPLGFLQVGETFAKILDGSSRNVGPAPAPADRWCSAVRVVRVTA